MKIGIVILISFTLLLAVFVAPFAISLSVAKKLAAESEPYQQRGNNLANMKADSLNKNSSILVVGDSTGVGTGATPHTSLAGLVGAADAMINITNLSQDGARIRDVLRQLATCQPNQYALVIMMVGGNDVIRFTSKHSLSTDMAAMLIAAKRCATEVVWIPNGNVGLAPIFPWPISAILTARARENRALIANLLSQRNQGSQENPRPIAWVDLYAEEPEDIFSERPDYYYAADKLHPSAAGYRAWFDEALRQPSALRQIIGKNLPAEASAA